jgi:hypothetical protein
MLPPERIDEVPEENAGTGPRNTMIAKRQNMSNLLWTTDAWQIT